MTPLTIDYVTYFGRGPGPLVSVLLPTRGRPDQLATAIGSLLDTTEDRARVQLVLKVDEDDEATLRKVFGLAGTGVLRDTDVVLTSPRGKGYEDIHLYLDQLAEASTGDWLFFYSDDAEMGTNSWDRVLLGVVSARPWYAMDDLCLVTTQTAGAPPFTCCPFPLFRRGLHKLLGRFPATPFLDAYLHALLGVLGMLLHLPVQVRHTKPVTTPLIDRGESRPGFVRFGHRTEYGRRLVRDLTLLLDRVETVKAGMIWRTSPSGPGWHWWRPPQGGAEEMVWAEFRPGETFVLRLDGTLTGRPTAAMGGDWSPKC